MEGTNLKWRLLGVAGLLAALLVMTSAQPALAHDPIIILPDQREPSDGPLLPDGTISFALYGTLQDADDQRGFGFVLATGNRLELSLLIPDLEPENLLPSEQLPRLTLQRPHGSSLEAESTLWVPFDEPFSMTRYIRIFDHSEEATGGLHEVVISGTKPARFTVAVGHIERFGTPVENVSNRSAGRTGVADWYRTPPQEVGPVPRMALNPQASEFRSATDLSETYESDSSTWLGLVAVGFAAVITFGVATRRWLSRHRH